jgi:transposase InsO family protein
MQTKQRLIRGTLFLGRIPDLSKAAKQRLKWFDYYEAHGQKVALTCRYFGISRQTFYRWQRRYDPMRLTTLEDHAHRPRHVRQPTWSPELAVAVQTLREANPRWGKDKLTPLLQAQGVAVSVSMVGRILTQLKRSGQLHQPALPGVTRLRRRLARPYGIRKPKDYQVRQPGDLVELDTMDLRPLPGVILKQYTSRDVVSRWDVLAVGTSATAFATTRFLDQLIARSPYVIRAIQVDGGSEFMAGFEQACEAKGIRLFVLPPRSPKLNGCVERANRTHAEEFWDCYDGDLDLPTAQAALLAWEQRYNTYRPHQALGYLTPQAYLQRYFTKQEEVSRIT